MSPIDRIVDDWVLAVKTQAGIQAFIKQAAEYLAEAGRASQQVTGDNPEKAIRKWTQVMQDEALKQLRQKQIEGSK